MILKGFPGGSGSSAGRLPPAMQETWVPSLGWEDPPGEGNGYPTPSILAWRIPWSI